MSHVLPVEDEINALLDVIWPSEDVDVEEGAEKKEDPTQKALHEMVLKDRDRTVIGMARRGRAFSAQVLELKDAKMALVAEYDDAIARIARRQAFLMRELRFVLEQKIAAGGPKDPKSMIIPGAGKLALRTSRGRWHVEDDEQALAWLRSHGEAEDYITPKLNRGALVSDVVEIMKKHGGEKVDGVEKGEDKESFSFTPAL